MKSILPFGRKKILKENIIGNTGKVWKLVEKMSVVIGVVGVGISTYFAYITYYNTEQIQKLDLLIRQSKTTTDTLIKVIAQLEQENAQLGIISGKAIEEYSESKTQSQLLALQLQNSNKQQSEANTIAFSKRKADINRLYFFFFTLKEIVPTSISETKRWDTSMVLKFVDKTLKLFELESTNPFLLAHDTLRVRWFSIVNDLKRYQEQFMFQFNNDLNGTLGFWKVTKQGVEVFIQPGSLGMNNYLMSIFPELFERIKDFQYFLLTELEKETTMYYTSNLFNDDTVDIPLKGVGIFFRSRK